MIGLAIFLIVLGTGTVIGLSVAAYYLGDDL